MKKYNSLLFCSFVTIALACNKSSFLDAKPASNLAVPSTLTDFQALLDNHTVMNLTPGYGEISSDNHIIDFNFWQSMGLPERSLYVWANDVYDGKGNIGDWNKPYNQIFVANQVIEGVEKIKATSTNQEKINFIKGSALFFRAYAFYHLTQVFCNTYDAATAEIDLGLPLKLHSDINRLEGRASLRQTYAQITKDLLASHDLLPPHFDAANRNRPSRNAVMALLARTHLSMRNYLQAGLYADSSLQLHSQLIDFSTLPTSSVRYAPFTLLNNETIFQSALNTSSFWLYLGGANNQISVVSDLYDSYAANDLRKTVYYYKAPNGAKILNGTYSGTSMYPFSGLATDEMYLIRAECFARSAETALALKDLNKLLENRWAAGKYVPYTMTDPAELLTLILTERRKELVYRGRWSDLRRLNKEGAHITLTRQLGTNNYALAPNSPLYTLPLPPDEISSSNIPQNNR